MTEQRHIPNMDQMKSTRLTRRRGRTGSAGPTVAEEPTSPEQGAVAASERAEQRSSETAAAPERRPTSRRSKPRPTRAQSNVDDAKEQVTLFLPNDVIAAANAHCDRGQDGKPLTHGAAVINALIAVDDQLADLVADEPAPSHSGWVVEQPMRRESGQNSTWTCSLMVRNRRQLDERADKLGVTRSRLVAIALRAHLMSDASTESR